MKLEMCYFIDIVLVIENYVGGGGVMGPFDLVCKLARYELPIALRNY
jgi:hypothetical protein